METEQEQLMEFTQCSVTLTGPKSLAPQITTTVTDDSHDLSTLIETQAHRPQQISNNSLKSQQIQDTQSNVTQPLINIPVTSDNVLNEISSKLSKRNKAEKKKILRRVMTPDKTPQKKDNQKRKEREKYAKDETYKAKKKCYSMSKYSVDPEIQTKKRKKITSKYRESTDFRFRQKLYMTTKYRENVDFKDRQKKYITKKYRENVDFKDKQKKYITKKYRENVDFKDSQKRYITKKYRENVDFKDRQKKYITKKYTENVDFKDRQKKYITKKYTENVDFKDRQKLYITTKYKENVAFKARQKQYITTKYSENVAFKTRQKEYIRKKYSEDVNFRQRQRSFMHHRYANDIFRHQHRQLMRRMMRDRYKKNLAYRTMHKTRCALKISQKYKAISKRTRQTDRESENPLIESAIGDFRSHIKAGPTHVCTVCHKASFPNQVQKCKRSNYMKNPIMVSACLKGQYVHECNDNCRNQCTVPDERKTEWICHTCHNHLKNGSMPKLAIANNLELADIPPELCDLNILERHLIAKCITFAKIIPLPKGRQRAIHGNVVCVPSEVQETIQALPRLRNESQVMRVKLKRRLSYRGHHLFQTVTWSKLVQALHKLKEIHPQYEDITIRDEEELCDPTLPDDGDEDEDDGNDITMNDDDYDDDDLMEIDRIEAAAMHDVETNVENDDDNTELCDKTQTQDNDDQTQQQDADMHNGGVVLESCLQPRDVSEEILCFSDSTYSVAPAERNSPVSFFKIPKLEAMAFPVQFPTGENTLDENRPMKLSPSSYFKARLFGVDDRFAKDTNYLFFAQFVTEIHLATSSMSIQLRKGKPLTRDGRKITSKMLREKLEVERLVRNRDAIRFMQPLRGTPAYWDKTTKDLFAMIRQLGSPTFFVTFSAAEMRWPEVIIAIKLQQGEEVNFEELDWSTKCDILRSNPVTTMRMFDKRVEALYRDLIMSPAQPLGKVFDFFWRLEFQHRGSPHIHGLLWVEGAPVFERDSDKTVCDFVSKHISAQLPDPNKQPELYKKVKEVQIHSKNHSKTCFKSASSGCRFGFPKPPSRQTMITRPVDDDEESERLKTAKEKLAPLNQLLNKPETESMSFQQLLSVCDLTADEYEKHMNVMSQSSNIILKREPKDCWVNTYNPHLLKAWDANIDVQFILSYYSLIHYICTYMCKSENSVSQYLQTLIQNSDRECVNECDEMKAVMQAYSKKREVSAQEAVARVTSLNMKKSSRSVVFVPTDDNPVKMSLPVSSLDNTTPDSLNVWMTSLTDKYKSRPESPEFEEMCMADFASTCRLVYGQQTKGKKVLPLLNELGFIQRRESDNAAVIRYRRISKEKYPEQFYGTLLRLYLPYRSDDELKRPYLPTYESFYETGVVQLPYSDRPLRVKLIVKRNRERYEKNSEEIDSALEDFEQNKGIVDEWCNLAPESELVRLECIDELHARHCDDENVQEDVPDYSRQANAATEARVMREPPTIDPTRLRQMYQSLNQKQACVFYAVRDWCIKRVCGLQPEQFFYYIDGGAGTGKSHLIKCIHSEASKILRTLPRRAEEADISNPTVLLTAFTGTAAFNISGTTLHSLLKLPRSLKPPFQGLGNQLDEIRCELLNAEIIIIDEISMVSKPLFAYVDVRLKQIKGSHKPFGGMSVIAVGDFYQLPPVRQSKPLCVYDPIELDLWRDSFQMITLDEIMRQKDDKTFAEMLNRLRVKTRSDELSEADRALLSQRVTEPQLCPSDVLHIFATNKQVAAHNSATLSQHHSDITTIDADDFKKDPQTGHMKRQGAPCHGSRNDLPDTLDVAVGARVMLIRNIDVSQGLVNGSFATIGRLISSENNGSALVTMLGLTMDDETAGRSYRTRGDNLVYIERSEEALKQRGVVRRQFPVKLAFACTIHKVQGMTRKSAVVSLKHIFEPGMAYVAISRVTSLSGLHMLDLDDSKIYANPAVTLSLQTMRQANFDHIMPFLQIQHSLSRQDTMSIIHHNTEGLPAHVNDTKSHHELCLADVLCLTETHLQGSFVADSLQFEGYTMFKRNRHLSYTNFPQMASKGGGGVAVYVKNHLQVVEKQYLNNVTDLEFVALKVESPVSALIAAVYRPPDYSVPSFLSNLGSLLDSLEIMDCHPIIVCGDFNENLFSNASKPILDFFQSKGYGQLITAATTDKNTLLDLIFISQPQLCLSSGIVQTYYSYHNATYCVISSNRS
ncbi:uncharacterized protein LOC117832690 isoform X2 [Xyrichtys novacula]|nr:uncharacterized protein LOC117832690 isoform X2 [Xyrichtys novacula]